MQPGNLGTCAEVAVAYQEETERPASPPYQLFLLALCLFALLALAVQTTVRLAPESATVLQYADLAVCAVFFADFLYSLRRAPSRVRYFFT